MSHYQLKNIHRKVSFLFINLQALLGLLGIIGNVLTFCVFSRKTLKSQPYAFYWKILSFSDTMVLLDTLKNWLNFVVGFNIQNLSHFFCKLFQYQPYVFGYISLWTLVLISIDRLVAIRHPTRYKLFKKRWFQTTLIAIVIVYSFLINIEIPLKYKLEYNLNETTTLNRSNSGVCYLPAEVQYKSSFSYSILVNTFLVNIVINNILHARLVLTIRESRTRSRRRSRSDSVNRDRVFTISSIAMNVSSCLYKVPFAFGIYVSNYYVHNQDQYQMIIFMTSTLAIVDFADLFFINVLFNKVFKREFLKMISFKKK